MNIMRYAQIDYTIRTQFLFLEKAFFTESFLSGIFLENSEDSRNVISSNFYSVVDDV